MHSTGSYRAPRELVWLFGCTMFQCATAEAFLGYLLAPLTPEEHVKADIAVLRRVALAALNGG